MSVPTDPRSPWPGPIGGKRRYTRRGAPAWIKNFHDPRAAEDVRYQWGTQAEWGWALPWLWSQLRDPRTQLRPPATPTAETDVQEAAAYWVPAMQLMLYGLGWSHPEQGLAAWLNAGRPRTAPALALLDDVWARDGQLEWLAAWLGRCSLGQPIWGPVAETPPLSSYLDWGSHMEWVIATERTAARSGVPSPLSGGSDALHLTWHCQGPAQEPRPGDGRVLDVVRPVLVMDGGFGWYSQLDQTPPLSFGTSVEVISVSLGLIGAFTRSPQTGRWHLADLDPAWHVAGN